MASFTLRILGVYWVGLVFFSLSLLDSASSDWITLCPDSCKCTYISNKKSANCYRAGYQTIPSMLSNEVQVLNLNENSIVSLEKQAFKRFGLINLKVLNLKQNKIKLLDKDAFEQLKVVFEINLSENFIEKLHPKTFSGLHKLVKLDLSGNRLTRLSGHQFPPLPYLRNLFLRNNLINYVNNHAFDLLVLLNHLSLSGNNIELMEAEAFSNKTSLKTIELDNNKWNCDCKLKPFILWLKSADKMGSQVKCHSPERLQGHTWVSLEESEIACTPELQVESSTIPVSLGYNASLICSASGDPLPKIHWLYNKQDLTNGTRIWYSSPERTYLILNGIQDNKVWSNLIIRDLSQDDISTYTCVAENVAGLVDKNISLVLSPVAGAKEDSDNTMIYVITAAAISGVLFILLLIICCYLCYKRKQRRQNSKQKIKQNGNMSHMQHKNIVIVNPVEKPPRQYEKIPQTDVELNSLNEASGHHNTSYDGLDYQDALALRYQQSRLPLATLDEECDDGITQDTTLDATLPLHTSIDQSNHFPDLLDNARLPRAISPTQLSYHSLIYPSYTNNAEWRYSYILPGEHARYPVGHTTPSPSFRPGYVTLPRRPRVPSWAGTSAVQVSEEGGTGAVKVVPVYDRLGPRTTVDGTSRTDLTKPSRSSILSDPYSLATPTSPGSPGSQNILPPHYTPIADYKPKHITQSATLPRSTPNLLEDKHYVAHKPSSTVSAVVHKPSNGTSVLVSPSSNSPTPSSSSTVRLASPSQASPSLGSTADSFSPFEGHPGPSSSPHNFLKDSSLTSPKNNNSSSDNKNIEGTTSIVIADTPNTTIVTSAKKKVPPKPPPKPSMAKRLSVTSPTADPTRKLSKNSDGGRIYQDEGPDGTEV